MLPSLYSTSDTCYGSGKNMRAYTSVCEPRGRENRFLRHRTPYLRHDTAHHTAYLRRHILWATQSLLLGWLVLVHDSRDCNDTGSVGWSQQNNNDRHVQPSVTRVVARQTKGEAD